MSTLNITLIDVAWGDSIFIESINDQDKPFYALIDSNDTSASKSSLIFIKKFFERNETDIEKAKPVFDFIMLSHAHSDHGQGLKEIMMKFGTKRFYYPKSNQWGALSTLISYANRSSNVLHHEALNSTKIVPPLGEARIEVLWPHYTTPIDPNENNNSIVLSIRLNNDIAILTGDAEAPVWKSLAGNIPNNTSVFKVPHHGSVNGTFDPQNNSPCWLSSLNNKVLLGISSHIRPFGHPHKKVLQLYNQMEYSYFRTDSDYHITFRFDSQGVNTKYSHF